MANTRCGVCWWYVLTFPDSGWSFDSFNQKGTRTASFDMSCLMLKLKLFGCWRFFLDYDWTMINHVDDFFSKLWVDHDSMLRFGETSSCSNHVLCGLWKGRKIFSHILPFLDQMKIFMLTWHFWWLTGLRLQHLAHPGGRLFGRLRWTCT